LTNQSSCSLNRLKLVFQKSAGEDNVNQQAFYNEVELDVMLKKTLILTFELPENEDCPNYAPYFRFGKKEAPLTIILWLRMSVGKSKINLMI
jgi:hypothetical protein